MFNLSGSEIVVILLLALVVLGPEKLPEALRKAGQTYAELRKMGTTFQREMREVMDEPMREARETAELIRKSARFDPDAAEAAAATDPTGAAHQDPTPPAPAETRAPAEGDDTGEGAVGGAGDEPA